jgi:hypothetical protein
MHQNTDTFATRVDRAASHSPGAGNSIFPAHYRPLPQTNFILHCLLTAKLWVTVSTRPSPYPYIAVVGRERRSSLPPPLLHPIPIRSSHELDPAALLATQFHHSFDHACRQSNHHVFSSLSPRHYFHLHSPFRSPPPSFSYDPKANDEVSCLIVV